MAHASPLIPAEAGTQSFGLMRRSDCFDGMEAKSGVRGSHWVPASAGMSGE